MKAENRQIGLGYWLSEAEELSSEQLDKLERRVSTIYLDRALKTLTLDELKKLMVGIKKLRIRRQRTA